MLAKDGIYIRDFPRRIQTAPIVPGGRADIMVRCLKPSMTYEIRCSSGMLATIRINAGPLVPSTDLESWALDYPSYLADLRTTDATAGCACKTELGNQGVNGEAFEAEKILHQTYLDAIVERVLKARNHPYHQHVYPFQLVDGFNDQTGYEQVGDWHDTIQGNGVIRY